MDKTSNLALIIQMIEAAEKNIQSAKQLLREGVSAGSAPRPVANGTMFMEKAKTLGVAEGGKVIEGVFDGQNMLGPDSKQYPVPANYASKSKLVEGDVLKLTIADDGSFIYKQIGPVERRKVLGMLIQDDKGDYKVVAEGKPYKVLLASLTYFKAEAGDEVTIVVPQNIDSQWAAVENVIKAGQSRDEELTNPGYTTPVSNYDTGNYGTGEELDSMDDSEQDAPQRLVRDEDDEF